MTDELMLALSPSNKYLLLGNLWWVKKQASSRIFLYGELLGKGALKSGSDSETHLDYRHQHLRSQEPSASARYLFYIPEKM